MKLDKRSKQILIEQLAILKSIVIHIHVFNTYTRLVYIQYMTKVCLIIQFINMWYRHLFCLHTIHTQYFFFLNVLHKLSIFTFAYVLSSLYPFPSHTQRGCLLCPHINHMATENEYYQCSEGTLRPDPGCVYRVCNSRISGFDFGCLWWHRVVWMILNERTSVSKS